jgi:hypothetical protein
LLEPAAPKQPPGELPKQQKISAVLKPVLKPPVHEAIYLQQPLHVQAPGGHLQLFAAESCFEQWLQSLQVHVPEAHLQLVPCAAPCLGPLQQSAHVQVPGGHLQFFVLCSCEPAPCLCSCSSAPCLCLCSSVFFSISARRKVRKISQKKEKTRGGWIRCGRNKRARKKTTHPFFKFFLKFRLFYSAAVYHSAGAGQQGHLPDPCLQIHRTPRWPPPTAENTSAFERSYARTANHAVLLFWSLSLSAGAFYGNCSSIKGNLGFPRPAKKKIPVRAPSLTPLRFLPRSGINS